MTRIEHHSRQAGGEFVLVDQGGNERGRLSYRAEDGGIVITHTDVDPRLRGGGLGRQLVDAAVSWARRASLRVDATCSFARAVLARS